MQKLDHEQLAQAGDLVLDAGVAQAGPQAGLMAGDDGHTQILFQNIDQLHSNFKTETFIQNDWKSKAYSSAHHFWQLYNS